ncbi:MAG: HAD family hydrolase [Chloroflexi bacterium]|nr:MAG: HAD family hydrolase [Chloroflexota bacterium]
MMRDDGVMLKAIIFDLDDTLIDWSGFTGDWTQIETKHLRPVYDYLRSKHDPLKDFAEFCNTFYTQTRAAWSQGQATLNAPHLGELLVNTAFACGVPETLNGMPRDEFRKKLLHLHHWSPVEGTTVFADVTDILTKLRAHKIKLALLTNAYQPMWMRDIEMRAHGLIDFFPMCRFSAADIGLLKPHPDAFHKVLECIGIEPHEAVFVGDSPDTDIAGAQAAGMKSILRVVKRTQPMISGLIVPDSAINTLHELPAVLDDWFPGWRD